MRANPVTGGLLALAALLPLTVRAESAGPTPHPLFRPRRRRLRN